MTLLKKKAEKIAYDPRELLTPTQYRIFKMDEDLLTSHYALIRLKQSRMSAEERRLIIKRVEYKVMKGSITIEMLQGEVDKIQNLVGMVQ